MGSKTVFPPDNEVILFFEEQRALASWFLGDSPRAWSSVEILIQIPTCILKRSTIQTGGCSCRDNEKRQDSRVGDPFFISALVLT